MSSNRLRKVISATLLCGGGSSPTPSERRELNEALNESITSFQSLLAFTGPSDSSRAELDEIEMPDSLNNDEDIEMVLDMSDELHLNVTHCVRLIQSAHLEWASIGGAPQDILKHAIRLWFKERREILEDLYTLLRTAVLDQVEPEIQSDLVKFLENIFSNGLRQRILSLLKELNREEPADLVGPHSEPCVLDSSGVLVRREDVLSLEKLILGHCLCLSTLVVGSTQDDIKEIFLSLKDCLSYLGHRTTRHQVAVSLLFSIVIAFVSGSPNASIVTLEDSFKNEFHEIVMATGCDPNVEGFIGCIRLAWAAHMIVTQDLDHLDSCLELVFQKNVFQFISDGILGTAAYQNHDDEDMSYIYNIYFGKLITCLVSHPLSLQRVRQSKDMAITSQGRETGPLPFLSLLGLVGKIYEKNQELLSGNYVLWTFVNMVGEGSLNFQTRVAFLNMLSSLASSQESTSKVFELLRWRDEFETFFAHLTSYHARFLQLAEEEGKELASYLNILQKVVEHGNLLELNSFAYVEPLFKLLLSGAPPYVKGALLGAIKAFVHVSPVLKDEIWEKLEEYGKSGYMLRVYDMQFELNEVEAMIQNYPSTISFLDLLNTLLLEERDLDCLKQSCVAIFFWFIYNDVFRLFPQRAYTDPFQKWQLVVACLQHFHTILRLYDISEEGINSDLVNSQRSTVIPIVEFLEDFTSGNTVFQNIMCILLPGVNELMSERTNQLYGKLLEKAVQLSMEIIVLVLEKDLLAVYQWRLLEVMLSLDFNQILALLEYVGYYFEPQIQLCSIKIMSILSSRVDGFVELLLRSNAAISLIGKYAACLELRSEVCKSLDDASEPAILIMKLLEDNISQPAPNITHFLLHFDLESPTGQFVLQPKFPHSCLKVILEILDKLSKPKVNMSLHESGFKLLYKLCSDAKTHDSMMKLLRGKEYLFFAKHLDTIGVCPLPEEHSLCISSLHQRTWLLKLLAVELYVGDVNGSTDLEACDSILEHLFGHANVENTKSKVLELLEIVQSGLRDTSMDVNANLDMFKAWSDIIEISALRRISSLGQRTEVLYQIIVVTLTTYPACNDKMREGLCRVALTCMIKLRDERFLFPDDDLLKHILKIFEHRSSESLIVRQYGLLLSFFQYCQNALDPDIEIDPPDPDRLMNQERADALAEFALTNFSILRKEAQPILDLVISDASQGSEKMKTMSLYVLDALLIVDDEKYFLQKLQTTGFLRNCIESLSDQEGGYSRELMQQARTLEAKLAVLLRISHTYGTIGAQVLFSMDILQHCASCRAMSIFGMTTFTPMLRLVFSLLVLIDRYDILEVKNNIAWEVANFVKCHNSIFDDLLWEEGDEEPRELARSIVSKVWRFDSAFPCQEAVAASPSSPQKYSIFFICCIVVMIFYFLLDLLHCIFYSV
ncbi:nuclear pore complex protein NUP205 [Rosa chinensis]|uniref:nuclear pore complex protein NUP205 n=1 Tax=Rosa chinensis TaxID=74649 RepID=UPI001AD8F00C|nr:nuclear pore complex protein NUP205 [Rosa chinensis]